LQLARRRLDDAVHSLVDPIPLWDHGTARWSDAVYVRLRGAITARTVGRRHVMAGSRAPCRIDVLTPVVDIDRAVGSWEPDAKGTVERLHQLAGHGWRPQDYELLSGYCGAIEKWVIATAELLGDRQVAVALRLPCPSCGEQFVYRHNGSESPVRSWALRVSEDGCECQVCRAYWPPQEFHWLAKLLGCETLPS
jgi:hypothetical protein